MEASVPGTSSATVFTERDPGNAVDIGASGAERRSRRRTAHPTTVSSIGARRSTPASCSESRALACPRSPGSKGWPGTPSPAGSNEPPPCVAQGRVRFSRRDPRIFGWWYWLRRRKSGTRGRSGSLLTLAPDEIGRSGSPVASKTRPTGARRFLSGLSDFVTWTTVCCLSALAVDRGRGLGRRSYSRNSASPYVPAYHPSTCGSLRRALLHES